jgi:hypothetical protein
MTYGISARDIARTLGGKRMGDVALAYAADDFRAPPTSIR